MCITKISIQYKYLVYSYVVFVVSFICCGFIVCLYVGVYFKFHLCILYVYCIYLCMYVCIFFIKICKRKNLLGSCKK